MFSWHFSALFVSVALDVVCAARAGAEFIFCVGDCKDDRADLARDTCTGAELIFCFRDYGEDRADLARDTRTVVERVFCFRDCGDAART